MTQPEPAQDIPQMIEAGSMPKEIAMVKVEKDTQKVKPLKAMEKKDGIMDTTRKGVIMT